MFYLGIYHNGFREVFKSSRPPNKESHSHMRLIGPMTKRAAEYMRDNIWNVYDVSVKEVELMAKEKARRD